jgi:hypothetical protein
MIVHPTQRRRARPVTACCAALAALTLAAAGATANAGTATAASGSAGGPIVTTDDGVRPR